MENKVNKHQINVIKQLLDVFSYIEIKNTLQHENIQEKYSNQNDQIQIVHNNGKISFNYNQLSSHTTPYLYIQSYIQQVNNNENNLWDFQENKQVILINIQGKQIKNYKEQFTQPNLVIYAVKNVNQSFYDQLPFQLAYKKIIFTINSENRNIKAINKEYPVRIIQQPQVKHNKPVRKQKQEEIIIDIEDDQNIEITIDPVPNITIQNKYKVKFGQRIQYKVIRDYFRSQYQSELPFMEYDKSKQKDNILIFTTDINEQYIKDLVQHFKGQIIPNQNEPEIIIEIEK